MKKKTSKKTSLRVKIISLVGILLAALLAISSFAGYRIHLMGGEIRSLTAMDLRLMQSISQIWSNNLQQTILLERDLSPEAGTNAVQGDLSSLERGYTTLTDQNRELLKEAAALMESSEDTGPIRPAVSNRQAYLDLKLQLDSLAAQTETFSKLGDNLFSLYRQNDWDQFQSRLLMVGTLQDEMRDSVAALNSGIEAIVAESSARAVENQRRTFLAMVIISAAAVIGGLLFAGLIVASILRQLGADPAEVEEIASRIAQGDLRTQVEKKKKQGILHSMDNMVHGLRGLVSQVKNSAEYTRERNQELSASSSQTATAIEQITSNLSSLQSQVEKLAGSIGETGEAVSTITDNITNLNQEAEKQASSVTESRASVEEMGASIRSISNTLSEEQQGTEELMETVAEGRSKLSATNQHIQELNENAEEIRNVVGMINNIASQTNILSMNASIEAAHAGERGRGFSIVADEIRSLAASSARNAGTIKESLERNDAIIAGLVESSEDTSNFYNLVEKNAKNTLNAFTEISSTMDELSEGTRDIIDAVSSLTTISEGINDGAGEIQQGIQIIEDSSKGVEAVSTEVNNAMVEISTGTNHINQAMQHLNGSVHSIHESVEEIQEELDMFSTV